MEAEALAAIAAVPPNMVPGGVPGAEPGPTPAVLADLIAAGLVSHEMIGDPDRLGGEAAALKALCAEVAGPVWRIEAYHYAFRAGAGDLGGRLGGLAPGDWTGAIAAALAGRLGPDAVWLNPTDLLPEAGAALDQPLLFLRAQAAAVSDGLAAEIAAAGPEVAAVISARYAAEVARLSTGAPSPLAAHVEALGQRLDAVAADVAALRAAPAGSSDALAKVLSGALPGALAEALAPVTARIDARIDARLEVLGAALAAQAERLESLAAAVEGEVRQLATLAAAPRDAGDAAFRETLGVTLAEIIARLEQRFETGYPSLVAPLMTPLMPPLGAPLGASRETPAPKLS